MLCSFMCRDLFHYACSCMTNVWIKLKKKTREEHGSRLTKKITRFFFFHLYCSRSMFLYTLILVVFKIYILFIELHLFFISVLDSWRRRKKVVKMKRREKAPILVSRWICINKNNSMNMIFTINDAEKRYIRVQKFCFKFVIEIRVL